MEFTLITADNGKKFSADIGVGVPHGPAEEDQFVVAGSGTSVLISVSVTSSAKESEGKFSSVEFAFYQRHQEHGEPRQRPQRFGSLEIWNLSRSKRNFDVKKVLKIFLKKEENKTNIKLNTLIIDNLSLSFVQCFCVPNFCVVVLLSFCEEDDDYVLSLLSQLMDI